MEKSNKRRYTLMVISFLFLLVATFVTVYNFKNTRAEETDAVEDPTIKESTKATCKGDSNFVFRSDGISGCEMTIDTLKNISGFQQQIDNKWVDIERFTLDTEYGIKMTDKLVRRYNSKYESYSDPWDYPADNNNILLNYIPIDIDVPSTICRRETFCCAFKLSGINSYEVLSYDSQKFRNKGNFHMIFNSSYPDDWFKGEFVYAFPSTGGGVGRFSKLTIDYYGYENECKYAYNQPLVKVTIDDRGHTDTEYYQVSDMVLHGGGGGGSTDSITSTVHYTGGNVYIKYIPPTRIGYVFDGFDSNDDIVSLSNNYYKLPITSDETAVQNTSLQKTYKMIERKLTVKWKKLPSTTVTFNFNAPDNVSSGNCTCDDSDKICFAFDNNPTDENFEYVVSAGSSIQLPTIRCPGINKKIKDWSGKIGNFKPTEDITLVANWVPINSGNSSSSSSSSSSSFVKYEVVLKKNCSGTFVCSSTTNSEVCTQLKNNGKFTKTVTKGDTFIFPKTFDTLTCDGKEISSWGSYSLGTKITVNNNIYLDAVWESSNGGGDTPDPSQNDDPIDNPQTGSIVIYLVLLFGIGALVYSVWYFRGFREN